MRKDITGERYNKLIAIKPIGKNKKGTIWLCQCDCGNQINVPIVSLTQKWRGSCGCLLGGTKCQNLVGKKFGRLTVLKSVGRLPYPMDKNHKTQPAWECLCDCGKKVIKISRALLHDKTKSCGCLQKEIGSINGRKNVKPETYLKQWYLIYKDSAKRRKIKWSLCIHDFKKLVGQNCYLCGQKPESRSISKATYVQILTYFSGVDRVDNNKGYILDNCRPCCTMCNRMKMNSSLKIFIKHIQKIICYYKKIKIIEKNKYNNAIIEYDKLLDIIRGNENHPLIKKLKN